MILRVDEFKTVQTGEIYSPCQGVSSIKPDLNNFLVDQHTV